MQHIFKNLNGKIKINHLYFEQLGQTAGCEGQPVLRIENRHCRAVIAYQGAQVLQFQRHNHAPLLWLSPLSNFTPKHAIRGGVPLCFPWFGKHPTESKVPSHGFARNMPWLLQSVTESEQDHTLIFTLKDNDETRSIWPHAFNAMLEIRLGELLNLDFSIVNVDQNPFDFTFAFHSYFAIEHIARTQILGLENAPFLDQLKPENGFSQMESTPIRINQETDRIYQCNRGNYKIVQDHLNQHILIQSSNCPNVIVWNPWVEKTSKLGDMSADSWQNMLCVESGRIMDVITLDVGQTINFHLTLSSV